MRRILLRVFAILAVGALLFIPLLAGLVPTSQSSSPDPVRVTEYDAEYTVEDDGTLIGKETLTGDFPYGRHGIFRYWDLKDFGDEHVRLVPKNIEITRDGEDEPREMLWESGRRFRVAKVGDAEVTLAPGKHTYVITYSHPRSPRACVGRGRDLVELERGGARSVRSSTGRSWPAAGPWRWTAPTSRSSCRRGSDDAQCAIRDGRDCSVGGAGTDTLTISAKNLPRTRR